VTAFPSAARSRLHTATLRAPTRWKNPGCVTLDSHAFPTALARKVGFNYTSNREISPGRLLYIHDAPKMNARVIDVERVK